MSDSQENRATPDPKRRRHLLEYIVVRIAVAVLSLMPMKAASWVGSRIGDLYRIIDRKHRERAYAMRTEYLEAYGQPAGKKHTARSQTVAASA